MNAEISTSWIKVQSMINGFVALLPNMVLALIVFLLFLIIARGASQFCAFIILFSTDT
jgi:hypothetical protein